jgi:hypothetical protein
VTYTIKGRRAAQQDSTQPTQMTRQYSAGNMSVNAAVAQPGSPGLPFIGQYNDIPEKPLGRSLPRIRDRQF